MNSMNNQFGPPNSGQSSKNGTDLVVHKDARVRPLQLVGRGHHHAEEVVLEEHHHRLLHLVYI